jgi:O-methyltransferase
MDGIEALRYILNNNIEGVIVECGVESGNFEHLWINELIMRDTLRDIYLYDTFGGLVEPSQYDYTCPNAIYYHMDSKTVYDTWKSKRITDKINGWCYTPLEQVQNRLYSTGYPPDKLHFIVGDVMQTLRDRSNIPDKIAILRLDTDWYESSKFELEQMYDNVVTGGVIIFDDYYHWDGQRRATDEFFQSINVQYNYVNIGNGKTAAIIKK